MRNLLLINLTILLISSCCLRPNNNLVSKGNGNDSAPGIVSVFANGFEKAMFKAKINIMGKSFNGLALIKKMEENHFRIAFFNELGMSFIEMEFSPDTVRVDKILESINYEFLIQAIQKDFSLLFMNNICSGHKRWYQTPDGSYNVLMCHETREINYFRQKSEYNYYFASAATGLLERVENCSFFSRDIIIFYENYLNNFPGIIRINHLDFDLNIELKKMEM